MVGSSQRVVDEAHLAHGSNPRALELVKTGSFTVRAEDGLQSLVVTADSGTVQVVANGEFLGGSVVEDGVLRVTFTGISGPNAAGEYSVELAAELIGEYRHGAPGEGESAALSVELAITDSNGQSATGSATTVVIDDQPEARLTTQFGESNPWPIQGGDIPALIIDETAGQDVNPKDTEADRISSADFSRFFNSDSSGVTARVDDDVIFGADGPGSVSYALSLSADGAALASSGLEGVASGLYAVDALGGKGEQILLYDNGGVIEGRIGGAPADSDSVLYFSLAVDADSGRASLTQAGGHRGEPIALWHPLSPDDHDELLSLDGSGFVDDHTRVSYQIYLAQTVTDSDGDSDTVSVDLAAGRFDAARQEWVYSLNFADDGPAAVDDGAFAVAEDAATAIGFAELLANDNFGADGGAGIALHSGAANGSVTELGDRFVYIPDPGFAGEDSFQYRITDGDGDTAVATVRLQVASDSVPLVAVVGSQVDEEGLAGGSNPDPALLTTAGEFAISTGGDSLAGLRVAGVDVTGGGVVQGQYGLLTIVRGADGGYRWSYTLAGSTRDHGENPGHSSAEGVYDNFEVEAIDSDGNSSSDDGIGAGEILSIAVLDDGPAIGVFENLSVAYNPLSPPDSVAADGLNSGFIAGADGWGSIAVSGEPIPGISYHYDAAHNTLYGLGSSGAAVFSLTVNADGRYQFVLLQPAAGEHSTTTLAGNPDAGSPTSGLFFGDVFVTPADPASYTNDAVNPSNSGLSGDANDFKVGEALRFDWNPGDVGGAASAILSSAEGGPDLIRFGLKAPQGATFDVLFYRAGEKLPLQYEGLLGTQDDGLAFANPNIAGGFDEIVLVPTAAPAALKITSLTTVDLYVPQDDNLSFHITAIDGDGDAVSASLDVYIDQQLPAAELTQPLAQTGGYTTLEAAAQHASPGADILVGTVDDNVFVWTLAESSGAADVVSRFDPQADALDLRDLLVAEEAEGSDLTSYLNVSFDGANTVIEVSAAGEFSNGDSSGVSVDQTITVEGVDLVGGDELATAIQNMLKDGQLLTD